MPLVPVVYVGIPVLTIGVNVALAYWIFTRHSDVRGSRWFVASLAVSVLWMALTVVTLVVVDDTVRRLARQFADKAAVWTFLSWAVFAATYSHTDFHERAPVRAVLLVLFGISLLPTFVEPFESQFYASLGFPTDPIPHVTVEPGPAYALTAILIGLVIVYALYELSRYLLATPRRSTVQLVALVFASFSVEIAIALGNFDLFALDGMSHGAYGVLPFTVLTSIALFRFRLFEMQPVARNAVVEDLQDPVVVLDAELAVIDYNRASTAVWPGIDGVIGMHVSSACPELADALENDDEHLHVSDRLSLEAGDTRRHFSLSVSSVGREDAAGPGPYAVLLRDVTDLERSHWQLAAQNERLDQVAATISHDLRNPISVADGYVSMVRDTVEDDDPTAAEIEGAHEQVRKIREAHGRMTQIIDDVLTIAREGKSVEETEDVSLSAVARDAWETVATGGATLAVPADRRLDADRSKLLTVFENLYRNALDHGGEDVTVTVTALSDGFAVADDGPGIPAADADEIFEYGYTTADDGTGLGLSIVRTIAESHGWTVELDADADGARFVFRTDGTTEPVAGQ